jgi:hypothetical protein
METIGYPSDPITQGRDYKDTNTQLWGAVSVIVRRHSASMLIDFVFFCNVGSYVQ